MRRALVWAGLGGGVGLVIGALTVDASWLSALRADPGDPEGLNALAFALRSWVPVCTALGLVAGMLGQLLLPGTQRRRAPIELALIALGAAAWSLTLLVALRAPRHGNGSQAAFGEDLGRVAPEESSPSGEGDAQGSSSSPAISIK